MAELIRDSKAPRRLAVVIQDLDSGEVWLDPIDAKEHTFSSGSVGFYGSGKIANPAGGMRYQVGINITLIGSKPKL